MNSLFSFTRKLKAKRAKAAMDAARRLYIAAQARGDTRGQHEAAEALKAATRACLEAGA